MEVLCWGGPEHGEVHRVPDMVLGRGIVKFPVRVKHSERLFAENNVMVLHSDNYIVKLVYAPYQTYTVLIYAEDAHRLLINLLETMNTLCRLVRYNRPVISFWQEHNNWG